MAGANKKFRTGWNAVVFTSLIVLSLVALNLIGTRLFGRVDLTEDRIYTLSPASKQLVKNLPDRVVAKAFISKDAPPQLAQIAKYLRDLLDEYKAASKGKFTWEAIDPSEDPKKEEEASRLGVQKLQIEQLSKEKMSIGSTYLGVAFQYGDKSEKLAQVLKLEGLEYEISSLIKRLAVKKKKIGIVQGQGEPSQQQGLQAMWGAMGQNYEVVAVTLGATPQPIPGDVDALLVIGPKQPYSDAAKKAIDDFLMQGKSVAFLVDGMSLETPRGQMPPEMMGQMPKFARKNEVQLESLLSAYGFKIDDDIIMDAQNWPGPVQVGGQWYLANQPYFPVATSMGKHETTDKLRGLFFQLASSVDVVGPMKESIEKKGGGAGNLVALARSSEKSWKQTGFFMLDPTHEIKVGNEMGPFTYGWAYHGPLRSAYGQKAEPPPAAMSTPDQPPSSESKGPVRLIVIGDSDFVSDDFMRLLQVPRLHQLAMQNGHFFLNIIDWLVQDETLTPIRGKGVTQRPIALKSENAPLLIKAANMVGLPLVFILYGVLRWRRRAAKRENFQI